MEEYRKGCFRKSQKRKSFNVPSLIKVLLTTIGILSLITGAVYRPEQMLVNVSTKQYFLLLIGVGGSIFCLYDLSGFMERWGLTIVTGVVFIVSTFASKGKLFFVGLFLTELTLPDDMRFFSKNCKGKTKFLRKSKSDDKRDWGCKKVLFVSGMVGILFVLAVGGISTLRYLTFQSPRLDFGIFSQCEQRGCPLRPANEEEACLTFRYIFLRFYMRCCQYIVYYRIRSRYYGYRN